MDIVFSQLVVGHKDFQHLGENVYKEYWLLREGM